MIGRILVTGGAGFLGKAVCRALAARGFRDVIVPRRADYDLTREDDTAKLFQCRPEVAIHLAAEVGGIGANIRTPGRFTYANLAMGANVVEQSRLAGVRKVVVVGTVCSYPISPPAPFREEDLWNGYPEPTNAGYGIAKRAVAELLRQYHAEYGLRGAVVIPTNLYGPGDNFDHSTSHVIPAMIRAFCGDGPVTLWGTGNATREFLHVDDAAEGIVLAAELVDEPEPINLGGGEEFTIRELAMRVSSACGYAGPIMWDASKPDGQPRRALDCARAREVLGWKPTVPFDVGLADTVAWWRGRMLNV